MRVKIDKDSFTLTIEAETMVDRKTINDLYLSIVGISIAKVDYEDEQEA